MYKYVQEHITTFTIFNIMVQNCFVHFVLHSSCLVQLGIFLFLIKLGDS